MGARGSRGAGAARAVVASYVRVAVGPGGWRRLRQEEGVYRTINEGHRRHFAAMGAPLGSAGIAAAKRSAVLDALAGYHAVLELPIVRVLADSDATSLRAVADAAAP